jgi:UDP-2-acetamido-2-deoxy-ribo-hexuluronate aminotransferase
MPKAISCIPHKQRIEAHRVEYLKAINEAIDHPWQSEDGREPSSTHIALETEIKQHINLPYWQFTNCCTDALQIAFHAFCKHGDTVVVPAYGWRAIVNAPQLMGMHVIYCDIDETGNLDINQAIDLIHKHQPSAILVVHNFGTLVDVSQLTDACAKYNVAIIEDAAPSFTMGEPYEYKLGTYSDAVCFSFDFTKSPGCLGAGGAIATSDPLNYTRFKTICSHTTSEWGVGTKSYLDTTSAAVLLKEIELIKQNNYRKRKVEIATYYLNKLPYKTLSGKNYIFHRFIILPELDEKEALLKALKEQRILAKSVYQANTTSCSKALQFAERAVELPCHQFIDINDLNSRIEKIL